MKLLNCNVCNDVVRLIHTKWKVCECGACGGQYNEDLLSATVAGDCSVFGISNWFFDKEFNELNSEDQEAKKKKHGHPPQFIWFGEYVGDIQIIRIENPNGPRIKMDVEFDGNSTFSKITDDRQFTLGTQSGKDSFKLEGNQMIPSFRPQYLIKESKN